MDAITLLKDDHQTVEKLFKRFEATTDRAHAERRKIVARIIEELSVHAAIEEQIFYPVTREVVPPTEDLALEGIEEHHIVKWLLHELEDMDPADERYKAKVTVLMENVRHHVEEEESDYFPKVRDALGRNAMNEIGDAMVEAKETAPTHPHPQAPMTPPGNVVSGNAAGLVDRVSDTVSGFAQGGVNAAIDLVARIRGQEKPRRPAPVGSPTAQRVAEKVRAQASDAIDEARDTGEAATKAAAAGAKATATTARKGASRTTSAAKATRTTARRSAKRTATTAKSATTKTKNAATSSS